MDTEIGLPYSRDELSALLPARRNFLWRWGEHCLAGMGPNTWVNDLERWLAVIRDPIDASRWAGYGTGAEAARQQAAAMGEVILAAGFLIADRAEPFVAHLTAACRSYAGALGGSPPVPDSPRVRRAPPAWGHDGSHASRLQFAGEYLATLEQAFPAAAVGMTRSALSDLVEPGADDRVLLGRWRHRLRLPLAFVLVGVNGQRVGRASTLTVEWFGRSGRRPVLVRDPVALGCTVLGPVFARAEAAARAVAEPLFSDGGFLRWGLDVEPGRDAVGLEGDSAGGALAVALVALAEGRRLDRAVVLASLQCGERGEMVCDGSVQFGEVAGVLEKAAAAYHLLRVRRVVLWHPEEPDDAFAQELQRENPGLIVERLGTVREAVDRLGGRVAGVVDFLRRIARNGLARNLVFRPPTWDAADPAGFCLPTQVVTDEEWQRLRERAERDRRGQSDPEARDYVPPTYLTYELGVQNEERVWPRDLERELDDPGRAPVVLRGEPGEGKTTALWAHVARRCLELAKRIEYGEIGVDGPGVRVPLALPLNEVCAADRAGSLALAALRATVETAYGRGQMPPPLVAEWLTGRVARTDAPGYELCLDALDELESQDGAADRRDWLAHELLLATGVPVLLTCRLTADIGGLLNHPRQLRVVCFGPRQVRAYVEGYFRERPHLAAQVLSRLALSPGPRHLAGIPLLLGGLCSSVEGNVHEPLPTTRTGLLGLGLRTLFVRGDRRRGHQRRRRSRNLAKERILYQVAWRFHAAEPQPIEEVALLDLLEGLLAHERYRVRSDPPADTEGLLRELEQDGVLVPLGRDSYRFVLRSFHEYCLAGWIAHESPAARDGDVRAFQAMILGGAAQWGRADDAWTGLRPVEAPSWNNVWPLLAGQLGVRAGGLLQLVRLRRDSMWIVSEAPEGCKERHYFRDKSIRELRDPDAPSGERHFFAEVLGEIGDSEAVGALRETLLDPGVPYRLRRDCATSLGRIGSPEALSALRAVLWDPGTRPDVGGACGEALGGSWDSEAFATLRDRLRDADAPAEVRSSCAFGLGRTGGPEALAELRACLHDDTAPPGVRNSCARALGGIGGPEALPELRERLRDPDTPPEVRGECAAALGRLGGPEALAELRARLHDDDTAPEVRGRCAQELGWFNDPGAGAAVREILGDHHLPPEVRTECVMSLHRLKDPRAAKALLERFCDPNELIRVRSDCAELLRRDGMWAALASPFRAVLRDPDAPSELRWQCAGELGRDAGPEVLADLTVVVLEPGTPSDVRQICASILRDIGHTGSLVAMRERLRDSAAPPEVRGECAKVLGGIGGPEALAELRERLRDPDTPPEVRGECAAALGRLGGPEALAELRAHLRCPDVLSNMALERVDEQDQDDSDSEVQAALLKRLDRGTFDLVGAACAEALGVIGGPEALAELRERLADPSTLPEVRWACAATLGGIGGPEALAELLDRLRDGGTPDIVRHACAEALGRHGTMGPEALVALRERLHAPDTPPEVRYTCATTLGAFVNRDAVVDLREELHRRDSLDVVRRGCVQGLRKIMSEMSFRGDSYEERREWGIVRRMAEEALKSAGEMVTDGDW